jgi:transposase
MSKRRKFTSDFKTRVVLEALSERETLGELSQRLVIHPHQIIANASSVFDRGKTSRKEESDGGAEKSRMLQKIGQLQIEVDFLKKASEALEKGSRR